MKLWLSRNTEVPLQEQLSAQLVMGMIAVMRPRFLDTSGDELLKAALGKLATQ